METFVCLGLVVVLVPIVLVVMGAVDLHRLKKSVARLERRLSELESARTPVEAVPSAPIITTAPAPSPFVSVPPPLPPRASIPEPALPQEPVREPPMEPPPPPPPARPAIDWEAFLGIKLFAWIGGFVLFLGIVFLVKYSFENNLITPGMRVVIGAVVGLALIVTGWFTATRRYRVSGQSLCATGVLVLYGNIFAAHVFYNLIALVPAFASMAIVTAGAFFLAVRMNAQVIVVLGLLGGFLTPVLLSTGVDNPTALFGYIAVLNAGIAAVALRKRWDYLVLLAAAGTVLIEFGWAFEFFDYPKANIALVVFLGFEAQFLAIFALRRRVLPPENWTARAAIMLGFTTLGWGFCLLSYPELGHRPGFLFTFAFVAEAGLLGVALFLSRTRILAPVSGFVLFLFLASWTGLFLNEALLWWALGGYVLFALLHATLSFWPGADAPVPNYAAWQSYLPLLPLVLVCVCVGKNQTSSAIWICLLVLDLISIGVAFARRTLPAIVIALVITIDR